MYNPYIFPHHTFFQVEAPNSTDVIEFVDGVESEYMKNGWSKLCSLSTIFFDDKVYHDKVNELLQPTLELLLEFNKDRFTKETFPNVQLDESWVNHYRKGDYQEPHTHPKHDMVGVFFSNNGPDFASLYFWQDRANDLKNDLVSNLFQVNSKPYIVDVKPGDWIFFPSYMFHGVTQHQSDVIRKTLSCNFCVYENS